MLNTIKSASWKKEMCESVGGRKERKGKSRHVRREGGEVRGVPCTGSSRQ